MGRLTYIPLDRIVENENVRSEYHPESIRELANSIRSQGTLINPITVRDLKNTYYLLLSGHRRLRAYKLLNAEEPGKWDKIPAIIVSDQEAPKSDSDIKQHQLIENIHREPLSPYDEAISLYHILQQEKCTYKELAQKIGKSEHYVQKSMIYLEVLEDIKETGGEELFEKAKKLPKTKIIELRQLKDKSKLPQLVRKIINNNLSSSQIRKEVSDLNEALSQTQKAKAKAKNKIITLKKQRSSITIKLNLKALPKDILSKLPANSIDNTDPSELAKLLDIIKEILEETELIP